MQKNVPSGEHLVAPHRFFLKMLLFMKLTIAIVLLTTFQVAASEGNAQHVTLQMKQAEIQKVFRAIEKQSPYYFLYNYDLPALQKKVDVDVKNAPVKSFLDQLLLGSGLTYRIMNSKLVVIVPSTGTPSFLEADKRITGTVTGEAGEPLAGVSIQIKGSNFGTSTDSKGHFSLEVPDNTVLIVSYVGYESQEISTAGQNSLTVALKLSDKQLDQVIVVGYGTQKKKDVTGAITTISGKEMEDRPNTQFGYAIQGKAAGVQVIRPSGQPQAGFSIRIRGTSTITAGSEPLYLVDGVPTSSTQDINPADIESITVLKDASAAAIYGSSGANGVVLITTKRGKNQKTKVNFNTYTGSAKVWKNQDVLNATQYKDLMTEMGQSVDWTKYTADKDWQKEVFRTAKTNSYQLSVAGGNETTGFYLSGGYVRQEGVVMTNELNRYSFKANIDHKISNIFKVGTSISYSRWKDIDVSENRKYGSINAILTGAPVTNVYNADGTFAIHPFIQDLENPVALLLKNEHSWINNRINANAYIEASLPQNIKLRSMFGYEQLNGTYNAWVDPYRSREGRGFNGIADLYNNQYNFWISENTATWGKAIGNHNLNLLAGFIVSEKSTSGSNIHATGFGSSAIPNVSGGSIKTSGYTFSKRRNVAALSRLNYSYDGRFLLTANFRADASTVFSNTSNPWGYFPSFSGGWVISRERFFAGVKHVNELKLRAGWGTVGNDQAADYASYGLVNAGSYYVFGNNVIPGTSLQSIENKSLKWETTKQTNIGLDLSLFNNRVQITTDYYVKQTNEMLLNRPIPASVGIPSNTATKNIGRMENRGFEFQVSSKNLVKELKWSTDFNISFNKSKIISLDGGTIKVGYISDRGNVAIAKEGEQLGLFYGYISDGVDPATGMIKYRDLDNSGTLNDADQTVIGNANPKYVFGLTNSFSYKNWSLNVFIQGVQGNDIFNATRIESEGLMDEGNQRASVLNRWKSVGQVTDMPKATFGSDMNSRISSRFIESGSFVRLKSVTLGYELPKRLLTRLKMSRLYVYVTSENLLTFTRYSGFDPEVSFYGRSTDNAVKNIAPGVDYGTYPQSREFILGLNITF